MPNREPSSSTKAPDPDRPARRDPSLAQQVDRGQRGDHAQRPVVRPAVEDRVEVRAGENGGPDSASRGAHQATSVAVAVVLDLEVRDARTRSRNQAWHSRSADANGCRK